MSCRDDILKSLLSVPPLPASTQQALMLLDDPHADVAQVTAALQLDPGLSSNLLRLANSALFGSPRGVESVRDAFLRLGVKRVRSLILAAGVTPQLKQEIRGYGLEPGELLLHSVAVATATQIVAEVAGKVAPDAAVTAGLLGNIGKTVLGSFLEIDVQPILDLAKRDNLAFEEAEDKLLGINHAEVGALLLEHWNLPATVVEVVRWQLQPQLAPEPSLALDLVHIADILAKMSGIGVGLDGLCYKTDPLVCQRLALTDAMIQMMLLQLLQYLPELKTLFA